MEERNKSRDERRELVRQKIQNGNVEERQRVVFPAAERNSKADGSMIKRVAAYCRVSTDDPAQTTSYELQKKYYEEEISSKPGWVFAGIYADEGISGTSLKNRDEFNRMIADCYSGKIDIILTKSVSRFARNVVDCLSVVRKLAQLNPPVGVKFETEAFDSLDATSELLLTVLAASAQEESKTKSNSMNWSLEHRFDNGNYLTPVLLGYDHDNDGNLIVNKEEAYTIRLMFCTYLAGFTLTELAELLMELGRPTKIGNHKWSASTVYQILTNERYCGNILTWKKFTYDFWEHKSRKNRADRKQVLDIDHHEAIVSHEIFDAVQAKLQMDKYIKGRHPFPTLDVVDMGALTGFVSVNRNCRGFTGDDYKEASESVYADNDQNDRSNTASETGLSPTFGLDGYEIARTQFFSSAEKPIMTISRDKIYFNTMCLKKFEDVEHVELLINTVEKCIAIRPCDKDSPNAIRWGRRKEDKWITIKKSIAGFAKPLMTITGWDPQNRYRLCGQYLSDGESQVLLFDLTEPEIIRLVRREEESEDKSSIADVNIYDPAEVDTESDAVPEDDSETVVVVGEETIYPNEWKDTFGIRFAERLDCYCERVRYKDNWEILRPAQYYSTAGGVSQLVLKEVQREARKLIAEMRCAV